MKTGEKIQTTGRIRYFMMLTIFIIFVIPYSLIIVFDYFTNKRDLIQTTIDEANNTARILAINIANDDFEATQSLIQSIKFQRPNIKLIKVIGPDFKVTHSSEIELVGITLKDPEYLLAFHKGKTFANQEGDIVRNIVPISSGISSIDINVTNAIEQIATLGKEFADLRRELYRLIIYGAIILIAIMVAVFFIAGLITNPVHNLALGMRDFQQGNLDARVNVSGRGEIRFLIETFNSMVQARKEVNAAIEKFIPKDFLNFLGKPDYTKIRLGEAVKRDFTILFTDMRSFSTLTENIEPDELLSFINNYLQRIAPHIKNHQGFIITYLGDAIMAAFPESADDAILCSIDIYRELEKFNGERMAEGQKPIEIGIGINSGTSMIGIIGSENRLEAAVMSDVVNLSARLESLTKQYRANVVFSAEALRHVYDHDNEQFQFRFLDTVRVKGKDTPVEMYELLLPFEKLGQEKLRYRDDYEAAVKKYMAGEILEAYKAFGTLAEKVPNDGAIEVFRRRCRAFMVTDEENRVTGIKLPKNFDGITTLQQK